MDLKGKTALVTGASSGIGRAIAVALARKQAHVLVHYRSNEAGALETLEQVGKSSGGAVYRADLMDRAQVIALFREINKTTSAIDVLVNHAGDARPGDIGEQQVWDYEYRNILLSAVHVTHEFLSAPSSRPRKIINITSIYGNLYAGNPEYLQYSAFKAALANLTTTLAKSAAPRVIVNAVAPGYTETPAWAGASKETKAAYARATSIGRVVTAEEVAHAVVFVAENDALVGQVLTLDGGTSLEGIA
jgi:3-oxoacyl-[acyl-carrier protein] reductase